MAYHGYPAEYVDCKCRQCGATFAYVKSQVLRGRGRFCTRACGADYARKARWSKRSQNAHDHLDEFTIKHGENQCWEWNGAKDRFGYGKLNRRGFSGSAHRARYEAVHGPIPSGMVIMHTCDNPPCTNPAHLQLGTRTENNADRCRKGRSAVGERAGSATMTDAQVIAMRKLYDAGGVTIAFVAGRFGVNRHTAAPAIRRRAWKHLP